MSAHGSKKIIYAALIGNLAIAIIKYGASYVTNSSAMLSEAIHSLVDTINQVLLLHGMKKAAKPADENHPFGYGKEIYFWSLIVAIMIFAIGSGISIYEGIHKIHEPEVVTDVWINYLVLALAFVVEGVAWTMAYREFKRINPDLGVWKAVQRSKDPTVFVVLFEDSAAMLGIITAAIGLAIGQYFDIPVFDGIASVIIGLILAGTAMALAVESKALLIGEAADPAEQQAIRDILVHYHDIDHINELLTIHFGPRDVLVTISLDIKNSVTTGEWEKQVSAIEAEIKVAIPKVRKIFIESQAKESST